MKPLAIDLFCGLGGWTDGLLAEGWHVIGFDNERHRYPKVVRPETAQKLPGNNDGAGRKIWSERPIARLNDANDGLVVVQNEWVEYPAQLVLQDVLTLHGSQFRDAALIVASPPCQEYSYMAMPWSRAKAIAAEYRSGVRDVKKLTALFDACFRIQREAIEAAGHFIPLVVENVRGACPWVGRSRWNYGSFHLWGDVPALMPMGKAAKVPMPPGGDSLRVGFQQLAKLQAESDGVKQPGISGKRANGKGDRWFQDGAAQSGSKSSARKAASAAIAKIPFALAQHIARTFKPIPQSHH